MSKTLAYFGIFLFVGRYYALGDRRLQCTPYLADGRVITSDCPANDPSCQFVGCVDGICTCNVNGGRKCPPSKIQECSRLDCIDPGCVNGECQCGVTRAKHPTKPTRTSTSRPFTRTTTAPMRCTPELARSCSQLRCVAPGCVQGRCECGVNGGSLCPKEKIEQCRATMRCAFGPPGCVKGQCVCDVMTVNDINTS